MRVAAIAVMMVLRITEFPTAGDTLAYLETRYPKLEWRSLYPNLAIYSDNLEQRESFAQTKPVPQKITDKVV